MSLPLESPRLVLRAFQASDIPRMHRIYSDPEVMQWVGTGPVTQVKQTEAMLAQYVDHQHRFGFSFWAVIRRQTSSLIGDCGLHWRNGEVELGYTLEREHWGRGYGTEAAGVCLREAFEVLGIPSLIALARPENAASIGVLKKLGFQAQARIEAYGSEHALYRLEREAWLGTSRGGADLSE